MLRPSFVLRSAALASLTLLGASAVHAAALASDNAANAAYADGWTVGDNGGSGFQPWSTIGNASSSGFGGGFIASGNGNVSIGTGANNAAFGIFGNQGGTGQAVRPFTGALSPGQSFQIDMDNQGIDNGGTVGFALQNSSGQNVIEYYFIGGQSTYSVNASTAVGTTPAYTTDGQHVTLTLGPADTYLLSADPNGATPASLIAGTLLNPSGGTAIDRVRLFSANGGPDVFFNNLAVTPEPTTLALLAGAGIVALRRRK